jgi:hypothetical protein
MIIKLEFRERNDVVILFIYLFEALVLEVAAQYITDCPMFYVFLYGNINLLLNAFQLLMLHEGMLTYLDTNLFFSIIFYNDTVLLIKIIIVLNMTIGMYIHFFSQHNGWRGGAS